MCVAKFDARLSQGFWLLFFLYQTGDESTFLLYSRRESTTHTESERRVDYSSPSPSSFSVHCDLKVVFGYELAREGEKERSERERELRETNLAQMDWKTGIET